ncbi:hypothetical protein UT300005_22700 [Clostridium sp. CTA-5]
MLMNNENFYIIKQNNGMIWNFLFKEDKGLIYKFLKDNSWSEYYVINDKVSKNFSVMLFSDDSINVLYQDLTGTIILSKYDGIGWRNKEILKNEKSKDFSIKFKAVGSKDRIHIIFSVLNRKDNTTTLFHESLDERNNLSNPKIIDTIKYNYKSPFNFYSPDNKNLFLMYQRFGDRHEIGYKLFDNNIERWSDFNLIDVSINPFNNYSAIMFKKSVHALYVKKEENIDNLIYIHGNNFNFKNNKLFKGENIESCLIFIMYGEIWCFWVMNNQLHSSFSINNGNNFSNPPYEQSIGSSCLYKAAYISNDSRDRRGLLVNEVYVTDDDSLQYLICTELSPSVKNNKKNNEYLLCMEYYMTQIFLNILLYEKAFKKNEQSIAELKYNLEEQKMQTQFYERKFKTINKAYTKFINLKGELNENANLLQGNLIDREEKIKLLERMNKEKEKEILILKEKFLKSQDRILILTNEVRNLKAKLTRIYDKTSKRNNR